MTRNPDSLDGAAQTEVLRDKEGIMNRSRINEDTTEHMAPNDRRVINRSVVQALVTVVATIVAVTLLALTVFTGNSRSGGSTATPEASTSQVARRVIEPGQSLRFTPAQRQELLTLTDSPAKRRAFVNNLRKGMSAFGLRVTRQAPSQLASSSGASTVAVNYTGGSTNENIFAQGWSGDHWWLTMSYADVAYGGTAGAVGACSVYLPWFVCLPIGGIIASWVRGWGNGNDHGIWLAVYRYGYITGGRW